RPVHQHREEQGESCLQRDHQQHVPGVVPQRDAEVALGQPAAGSDGGVVVEPDEPDSRRERAAAPRPVREADPQRHEDGDEQEHAEDHQHGEGEDPPRQGLAAAQTGPAGPAGAAGRGVRRHAHSAIASRLDWAAPRIAVTSPDSSDASWALRSVTTSVAPAQVGGSCAYCAPSRKAVRSGLASVQPAAADSMDGMGPNASENASCCSVLVRCSTRLSAASWFGLSAAMPQQFVNWSVPGPAGPAGSSATVKSTSGKSFSSAPVIQLPSITIAASSLPNASPPQPAPRSAAYANVRSCR